LIGRDSFYNSEALRDVDMTKSWRQEKKVSVFFEISHHEGKSRLKKSQRFIDRASLFEGF
jgi:hypothetical protein